MIPLSLREIAEIVHGFVVGDDDVARLMVTGAPYVDSRHPVPQGLFVAVVGERVDGHDHAAGSHAVLGSRPTVAPTVVVDDVLGALGTLARHVVAQLAVPVVALTGSQGKTSTKDLLAHVLGVAGPTVATVANNNNEIGVPLTVLRAEAATRHLVVEMGARGIGHIAYLCGIAPPTVAAVLNVGTAHIGEFGSREAIAQAKGEIVEALGPEGTAVLNADDPLAAAMDTRTRARVLSFGESGDVRWRAVGLDELGRASFELGHDGHWVPVRLRQTGAHHVPNATAAAAMALALGLDLPDVGAALSTAEAGSRSRMELHTRGDGLLVVNDAYNANPASMRAALDALVSLGARRPGRTIAVLGEMKELGADAESAHREVGAVTAAVGVDALVVVGEPARAIADGARAAADSRGPAGEVILTAGREAALAWVRENARGDDVVLVKASNGAALEWLADRLLQEEPAAAVQPDQPSAPHQPEGGATAR